MARASAAQQMPLFSGPQYIPLDDLGTLGIIKDRPGHVLPPEAFTDGNNIRFQNRMVQRILGHTQVYGTPLAAPDWVFEVPSTGGVSFWLYGTKTNAYVYDGTHHTITRGSGTYITANQWDWDFSFTGGIPYLNNQLDPPQYWPALSSGTLLANLVNFPANTSCKRLASFGLYSVMLNVVTGGTSFPHMVWWSAKTTPGAVPPTWDFTDATHDAGRIELTDIEGGEIVTGLMLGNVLVIYKQLSTHVMRFVGGQDIMGFEMILSTSGALTKRTVCAVDKGQRHFVVSKDDALFHYGFRMSGRSILNERERVFLFQDMDPTNYVSSFVFDNVPQREAWFCYPSGGNVLPNKVMIWNYQFDTIQFRDFNGLYVDVGAIIAAGRTWTQSIPLTWQNDTGPWAATPPRGYIFSSPSAGKLYQLDSGLLFDTSTPTCFVERQGLAIIGRDRKGQPIVDYNSRKQIVRVWPKINGTSVVLIKCGGQERINGPITWAPAQSFNPQLQTFLDFSGQIGGIQGAQGRLLAYNITSNDAQPWEIQGFDLEVNVLSNL